VEIEETLAIVVQADGAKPTNVLPSVTMIQFVYLAESFLVWLARHSF